MSDQSLALRDTITPEEYARNAAKIEGAKAYLASLEAKNEAGKQKFEADLVRRIQEGEQAKQLLANMGRYTTVGPNSAMETLPSTARIEEVPSTSPPIPQTQWNQSNRQHSQANSSQPNHQYDGRAQPNGYNPVHQQYQSGQSVYNGPYSNTRYNYSTSYPATSSTQTQHFPAPSLRSEPPQYNASQPQNVPLQRPSNQAPAQGSGRAPVAPTHTPQQPPATNMNWIHTPASDAPEDRMKSILDFRSAVITWASQAPPSSYVDVNSVRVYKDAQGVVHICRYSSNGDPIKQSTEVFFDELITQLQRSQQLAAARRSQPHQSGRSTTIAQSEATLAGSNANARVPQNSGQSQARPTAQPASVKPPTIVIPPRPSTSPVVHQNPVGQPQLVTKVPPAPAPTAKPSELKTISIPKLLVSSTTPSLASNAQPSVLQQAKNLGSGSKDANASTAPTRTSTPSTTSTSSLADALQRQVTPPTELSVPIPVTPDLLQRQRTLVNGAFRSPQDANKKRLARDLLTALGKRKADATVEVGSAAKRTALEMKVVEMGGQKHVWQGHTFQPRNMHYSMPQGAASGVWSGYIGGDVVVPRPAQRTVAVPLMGRPPLPPPPPPQPPQPPVYQQPPPPAQPQFVAQPAQSQHPAHTPSQSNPQAQAQVATSTLPPQYLQFLAHRIPSAPQNHILNPDGGKPSFQVPTPSRAGNASAVTPVLGVVQPEAASSQSQKGVAVPSSAPAQTNGVNGTGGAPTSAMNVLPAGAAAAVPSSVKGKEKVNEGVIPVAQADTGKGSVEVKEKAKDVPPPSQSTAPTTTQTPASNAPLPSKGVGNTVAAMNIPLLERTTKASASTSTSTSKSAPKPKPKARDPAPSSSAFAPKAHAPEIIDLSSPTRGTTPILIASSSTGMPLFLPSPPSSASAGPLPPSSRASISGESVQSRKIGRPGKAVKKTVKRQRFYIQVPPPPEYLVEYREQEKSKGRSESEGSGPSVAIISRPGSRMGGRERVFEGYVNEPVIDPEEQEAIEISSSRLQPTPCRWAECNIVLNSADALMRHLTMQHEQAAIGSSRNQSFICRWTQCGRQSRSGDGHVEKHALLPLRCAYSDCKDSFRSGPQLLKHNRKQHSKSELKPPAMPFVGQVLEPQIQLPRHALPANMFVTAPVRPKSIKPDRHKVIGQWVARNILGCGEDQEKHRNPLKRAKKTARPLQANRDPYPSYEFLDDRTVRYGSLLSQSIDLRTENLDSVTLSREFDQGLTLWPPQPPAPPPEELGRGNSSVDRPLSPLDLEMGDVLMGDAEDGDHRSAERDAYAETVEVEDMLIGTNSPIL